MQNGIESIAIPQTEQWEMLDFERWESWEKMNLLQGKSHFLKWNECPANSNDIRRLKINTLSPNQEILPEVLSRFNNLRWLQFGKQFLKNLNAEAFPATVEVLMIEGEGSATWPSSLRLPQIIKLGSLPVLKFSKQNFPNLIEIGGRLDPKGSFIETITQYAGITKLGIGPLNSTEVFKKISALPLRELKISGGKLSSLQEISLLKNLTMLDLVDLQLIENLNGLELLSRLEVLNVSYCRNLVDLTAITALTSLKQVTIRDCKKAITAPIINFCRTEKMIDLRII